MDTAATYTIRPKKYPGVRTIQKSALEDILGVLKAILDDGLFGHDIKEDCVVVTASVNSMERLIKRSNMSNSCVIERRL